jgi:hypothetical protein
VNEIVDVYQFVGVENVVWYPPSEIPIVVDTGFSAATTA